jgi:hypothetical protein
MPEVGHSPRPTSHGLTFEFFAFRFHFSARDSIYFPPGKSGNVVRGAFGTIFRKIACVPECREPRTCEIRATCPYARLFEPAAALTGSKPTPSGLGDWPRPFVFRASHLDACTVEPGERFHFDVHIFDVRDPVLAYFVLTFAQLVREGVGPGRGRAELVSVNQLGLDRSSVAQLYDGATPRVRHAPSPVLLDLSPHPERVRRVRVRFVTPTEVKSDQRPAARPEFSALFARIRDRLSALRALYGPGPLEIDFRAIGERAAQVRMTRCDTRWVEGRRRSAKTGQSHPLGGFIGEAEYEGELAEFLPYLQAAHWTGVGRQTVWGKGVLEVDWTR